MADTSSVFLRKLPLPGDALELVKHHCCHSLPLLRLLIKVAWFIVCVAWLCLQAFPR